MATGFWFLTLVAIALYGAILAAISPEIRGD